MNQLYIKQALEKAEELIAKGTVYLKAQEEFPFKRHNRASRALRQTSLELTRKLGEMRHK